MWKDILTVPARSAFEDVYHVKAKRQGLHHLSISKLCLHLLWFFPALPDFLLQFYRWISERYPCLSRTVKQDEVCNICSVHCSNFRVFSAYVCVRVREFV